MDTAWNRQSGFGLFVVLPNAFYPIRWSFRNDLNSFFSNILCNCRVNKEEFDEMYSLANKARSKIRAFIKYLKQGSKNEDRGTKNDE